MNKILRAIILAASLALVTVAGAGAAPAGPTPASLHGGGTWLNTAPCVVQPGSPDARGVFVCVGPSIWHGPLLDGTTIYVATFTIDAAGNLAGTLTETFTGTAANGARGTLRFVEAITISSTGVVFLTAEVVGGTGDFCHARGHLVFTGTATPDGIGDGTYTGHLVTPRDCR